MPHTIPVHQIMATPSTLFPPNRGKARLNLVGVVFCLATLLPLLGVTNEFQASGNIILQQAPDLPVGGGLETGAKFTVIVSSNKWQIKLVRQSGVQSWISFDGQSYYLLTHMPAGGESAATVSQKLDSGLPEFEKMLLFAFHIGPDPEQEDGRGATVPFLGGPDPASYVYEWNIERSDIPPQLPTLGRFTVSEKFKSNMLARLVSASDFRWATYISNYYGADLPPTIYRLTTLQKTNNQEVPLKFELRHPYRKDGVIHERYFRGETTDLAGSAIESILPPLKPNTSVQDVRLGKTYLYKPSDSTWLTAERAATVGKLLIAAPQLPSEALQRVQANRARTFFQVVLVLCLVGALWPILIMVRRRRRESKSSQ